MRGTPRCATADADTSPTAGAWTRGGLCQLKVAHVAKAQIEVHACLAGTYSSLLEHRWRGVDPEDTAAGPACERDGDTTVPDRKLDEQTVGVPIAP